jgi:signal transduction histidine kinase
MREEFLIPFKTTSDFEELFASSIEVNEKNNEKLALELHEELGSDLVAIQMKVQQLDLNTKAKDEMSMDLKMVLSKVRKMSSNLYPLSLEELGLLAALRIRLKEIKADSNTEVNLAVNEPFSLTHKSHVESTIYFCIDEILNFFTDHCNAESLLVEFSQKDQIIINIKDDVLKKLHHLNSNSLLTFKIECMSSRLKKINSWISVEESSNLFTQIKIDYQNAK